ncbi:Membrane protein TMS1 [Elsinoe australis]|uniref:Membrane protein TMS1 n=1 Tax=Elsinoe australis TaxID=40998 RepID=A0A2P7YMT7_9PEZI|nr:Membrane protein TMS1 [Elsinoe australis]
MGALLSLPLLAVPSIGTVMTFAASCCGAATCSAVCSACGKCNNSMATRIAYAVILLLNSILSWVMVTDWAVKKLEHVLLDYTTITCAGRACSGFVAVHRINFALGFFHFLLALLLFGVRNTKDNRAALQNGFWGPKIIAWIGFIVLTFLIPDSFFVFWGSYIAIVGAVLFLLLGLILLVDLAHTWAEYCLAKVEDEESNAWKFLLIGSTLSMYLGAIAMTIIMYIFFAKSSCTMNQAAITVNLILLLIISVISVHPMIQESNPRAGLAQAAMVCIYCTYLTFSAMAMEPDDRQCNPLIRASGARKTTIILGAIVTFATVAYTTTRAATYGLAMGAGKSGGYHQVGEDDGEHGLVDRQPDSRREMRAAALRQAVAAGSLPASALDESDDEDDEEGGKNPRDDEKNGTQYNYTLFHVIFLLSTMWVATLLAQEIDESKSESFSPVGRTYFNSWTKIVSSW